jgi:hypothetical protein
MEQQGQSKEEAAVRILLLDIDPVKIVKPYIANGKSRTLGRKPSARPAKI